MLTFEQIKELIEEVAERGLEGLELERSGFRLKIDGKRPAPVVQAAPLPQAASAAPAQPPAEAPPAPAEASDRGEPASAGTSPAGGPSAAAPAEEAHVLTSPIVGTFYRRPSPEADPFVEIGSRVKKGQVLCIVEAMKLMNEIESDVDGVVLEVYPQNAQPVEFGEPLFAVRTD